ncbi:DeoR/GlpR family DNA-binding transcription regulator [Metasolibacillus sp. FSL H7-0170]|uniref:DeoR/GlpR family DNA-binding transcription regulator n=1 Tax=Metasolibacillus sp. FSL H7-0170 TaxID=2921431 RepID=UPI0031584F01
MLPQNRQNEIMEHLQKGRIVKIADMSKLLKVSRETVRKDLYELQAKGLVQKIHGGAIINEGSSAINYAHYKIENEAEKRKIAKRAARFVEDGDIIFIDHGITSLFLAQEILNKERLTVITNSLLVVNQLADYTTFDIVLIGGRLRKNEKSLDGAIAYKNIEKIYVDKGFFNGDTIEQDFLQAMINHCQIKLLMVDSSLFKIISSTSMVPINKINILITDINIDKEILRKMKDKNILIAVSTEK